MNESVLSLFKRKSEIESRLRIKRAERKKLRAEIKKLEQQLRKANEVKEVWDGVPIGSASGGAKQSLDVDGRWILRGQVFRNAHTGRRGIPVRWRIRINEYDPESSFVGNRRWAGGCSPAADISSEERAWELVREWILKYTLCGLRLGEGIYAEDSFDESRLNQILEEEVAK